MRLFLSLIFVAVGRLYAEPLPPQKLVVTTHYGAGFFAEVLKVIDNILHFQEENLKEVYVDWSQEFFPYKDDRNANGWDLYFEPIQFSNETCDQESLTINVSGGSTHEIHDFVCVDQWINYDRYLPYRLKVNEMIQNYARVKSHIIDKVNAIIAEKMSGYYCIGVHVRYGSDHSSEEPLGTPTVNDYLSEVKDIIRKSSEDHVRVYLATDSDYVVQRFREAFPSEMLLTINTFRVRHQEVPHLIYGSGDYWLEHKEEFHQKKPGYFGGEGVLMDTLLLAHCDIFVHSTSNIASFVSFYNPYISSVYLPKGQRTRPCRFGK